MNGRRLVLAAIAAAALPVRAAPPARVGVLEAPNIVAISPEIVTSGQPTAASLRALASEGFAAVIYLAPPTSSDAVKGEDEIVRAQGMEFINIPIPFNDPTDADFAAFVEAMNRLRGRKVLVHCQVNMRASTFTFLYRTVALRESPEKAFDDVAKVWSPSGAWRRLMVKELKKANIAFDPY